MAGWERAAANQSWKLRKLQKIGAGACNKAMTSPFKRAYLFVLIVLVKKYDIWRFYPFSRTHINTVWLLQTRAFPFVWLLVTSNKQTGNDWFPLQSHPRHQRSLRPWSKLISGTSCERASTDRPLTELRNSYFWQKFRRWTQCASLSLTHAQKASFAYQVPSIETCMQRPSLIRGLTWTCVHGHVL